MTATRWHKWSVWQQCIDTNGLSMDHRKEGGSCYCAISPLMHFIVSWVPGLHLVCKKTLLQTLWGQLACPGKLEY